MLILSRKCRESLIIADRIVVTILAIDGAEVRLGIEVPAEFVACPGSPSHSQAVPTVSLVSVDEAAGRLHS